jgi:predicted HTH transcriptional regulator
MSTTTKLIPCEDKVLKTIQQKPMTFMKLVEYCGCATETVEKYLSIHLNENKICQKKGKFRILHSPKLTSDEIQFYELMLNPTIKSVVLILLKSKPISQIELVAISEKSNPSISRALRNLLNKKIIQRNYHAPFSTYEIIDKPSIFSILKITHPNISNNYDQFDLCHPKPIIFANSIS